ncbi:Sodium channel protein 60E [Diplonema papillatum]|nr:Sodium channel protein 60E [Diplonema papillatum]
MSSGGSDGRASSASASDNEGCMNSVSVDGEEELRPAAAAPAPRRHPSMLHAKGAEPVLFTPDALAQSVADSKKGRNHNNNTNNNAAATTTGLLADYAVDRPRFSRPSGSRRFSVFGLSARVSRTPFQPGNGGDGRSADKYLTPAVRGAAMQYLALTIADKNSLGSCRLFLYTALIRSKVLDQVALVLILLNCVFLAMEDPTDSSKESNNLNRTIWYAEVFFTVLFTAEMLLRIAAQGFLTTRLAYLKDSWNCLDFVIVLAGICSLVVDMFTPSSGAAVSCLRSFRLFKPLRAVTKVREVQIIVNSLLQSLPQLIDVLLLYSLFLLIMGIVSVQIWKGQLSQSCVPDPALTAAAQASLRALSDDHTVCVASNDAFSGGHLCPWGYVCADGENPQDGKVSFDNIYSSLLTLFTVVTMEGWTDIMYLTFDASGRLCFFYYLVVIAFGSFFIVNLSLVIINNAFVINVDLQRARLEQEAVVATAALPPQTDNPLANLRANTQAVRNSLFVNSNEREHGGEGPGGTVRGRARRVVTDRRFSAFIAVIIVCNCLVLASQHYGQPAELSRATRLLSYVFAGIYVVEIGLKLVAYPFAVFFSVPYNVLELVIIVSFAADLVLGGAGVLNSLRLLRLFHLAQQFPYLWSFLLAIMNSVKGVAVLTSLLGLVMFIYALLGMQIFGARYCNLASDGYGDAAGSWCPDRPRENFDNLGWALISVFQIITGEDWNLAMHLGMRSTSDIAALYFVSLFVIGNYVVLNLFIAVLLGGLESTRFGKEEEDDPESQEAEEPRLSMQELQKLCGGAVLPAGVPSDPLKPGGDESTRVFAASSVKRHASSLSARLRQRASASPPRAPRATLHAPATDPVLSITTPKAAAPGVQGGRYPSLVIECGGPSAMPARAETSPKPAPPKKPPAEPYTRASASPCVPWEQHDDDLRLTAAPVPRGQLVHPLEPAPAALDNPPQLADADIIDAVSEVAPSSADANASPLSCGGPSFLNEPASPVSKRSITRLGGSITSPPPKSSATLANWLPSKASRSPSAHSGRSGCADEGMLGAAEQSARRMQLTHSLSINSLKSLGRSGAAARSRVWRPGVAMAKALTTLRSNEVASAHVPSPAHSWAAASERRPSGEQTPPALESAGAPRHPLSPASSSGGEPTGATPHGCAYGEQLLVPRCPDITDVRDDASSGPSEESPRAAAPGRGVFGGTRALFFLSDSHPVRAVARLVAEDIYFECLVILFILASTVSLALEDPFAAPDEKLPVALELIGMILACGFLAEALLKIVAYGFVLHSDSYLRRDSWNALDFLIAAIGAADFAMSVTGTSSSSVKQLDVLRLFRTLRPLRFINKSPGLKLVVDSLIGSIKGLTHVVGVTAIIFTISGIMGMQLFMGRFHSCTFETWGDVSRGEVCPHAPAAAACDRLLTEEACIGSHAGYRWEVHPTNFDNMGRALVSLFEIATLEGWVEVMHVGIDSNGDGAPVKNAQPWLAVYFLGFIVIGAFFLVNLFVGVLLAEYEFASQEASQCVDLTLEQKEWSLMLGLIAQNSKPLSSDVVKLTRVQTIMRPIVNQPSFDLLVSLFISLNVLFMALEHADQSFEWDRFLFIVSLIFLCIFSTEAAMKLVAFGFKGYITDRWNRFDFFVLLISLSGLILGLVVSWRPVLSVLRILRLARLLRVSRMTKGIRMLIRTLFLSLPSLVNVAALLALLFSLYAILGIKMFGRVSRGPYLTDYANFENFFNSALLLFRVSTGEGWQGLMQDCRAQGPYCDAQLDSCGSPVWAYVYYVTFVVIAMFVLLSLIVAVILREFTTATEEEAGILCNDDVHDFSVEWEVHDAMRSGFITVPQLLTLLGCLQEPLGCKGSGSQVVFIRALALGQNLLSYDGKVYYREVLLESCRLLASGGRPVPEDFELPPAVQAAFDQKFAALFPRIDIEGTPGMILQSLAAIRLQSLWRGYRVRKSYLARNAKRTLAKAAQTSDDAKPAPASDNAEVTPASNAATAAHTSDDAPPTHRSSQATRRTQLSDADRVLHSVPSQPSLPSRASVPCSTVSSAKT